MQEAWQTVFEEMAVPIFTNCTVKFWLAHTDTDYFWSARAVFVVFICKFRLVDNSSINNEHKLQFQQLYWQMVLLFTESRWTLRPTKNKASHISMYFLDYKFYFYFPLSVLDSDTLHLCEEVIGIFSSLPSHTRVLHSSKWEVQISHQPAVGPHQTCLQPLGHPVNLPHILGPHCGWQTVTYTIAPGNSFILSIKGADARDGTKDLLLHDTGAVRYACDDRRRHEVSRLVALREVQLVEPLTAVNYATFWFGQGYIATNLWIQKETFQTVAHQKMKQQVFSHILQYM